MPDPTPPPLPPIPPPGELAQLSDKEKADLLLAVSDSLKELAPLDRIRMLRKLLPYVAATAAASAVGLAVAGAVSGQERPIVDSVVVVGR